MRCARDVRRNAGVRGSNGAFGGGGGGAAGSPTGSVGSGSRAFGSIAARIAAASPARRAGANVVPRRQRRSAPGRWRVRSDATDPIVRDDTQHCPHFGRCGGCSLLDVPIDAQLAGKQARARELLQAHLGDVDVQVALPPRTPRHDRISILYPVQPRRRGATSGIYRRGTHQVEPITDCRIQHRALTTFGVRANDVLRHVDAAAYDERTGEGHVRAIRARLMPGTGELLVGAVVTSMKFPGRDALVDGLWAAAAGLRDDQGRKVKPVGFVLNVNDQPGNALLGAESHTMRGDGWQHDRVGDLRLRVGFGSFYQLNRHADAILFRPAMAMLGDVTGLRVVDGYGGVGTFALRLLRAGARHVTLIESSPSACADARHNLRSNGLAGGEVHEQPFGGSPLPDCDLLVVDPPRAGLMEQGAEAVLANAPPRALLVSCSLESLQRDLDRLAERYRVTELRLCDLFPHTEHVEALTMLARR